MRCGSRPGAKTRGEGTGQCAWTGGQGVGDHAAMKIAPFALERYFARYEFSVRHNFCASDVEPLTLRELLALADDELRERWETLSLGYTESAGLPRLRTAISGLYGTVEAGEVLVLAGAAEAIFLLFHALLEPGDHAVVIWPAYQSLHEVARAAGAEVTPLELDPADWSLDLDALRRVLRPTTRAVVVNFPHSPTGALPSRAIFQALVDLCEERGITLVSDEVYRGLEHPPRETLPPATDLGRRAVSIGVMSKSFALAGLRIGWLATHDAKLLERCAMLKDYTTLCLSAPSEILALIALASREPILARSRALLGRHVPLFADLVARHPERLGWVPPAGGSVAFPRLVGIDADQFAASLVEHEEVLILPGSLFGMRGEHFRVGFGRADFPEALARFERHLMAFEP
jgi:aspartate/methionine/tyrosine aminotransferase